MGQPMMICFLTPADCTGTLDTAYVYARDTDGTATAKICVYTEGDADTVADTSDLKVGCSAAINESGGAGWKSGVMDGGSVTNGINYWLCMMIPDVEPWETNRGGTNDIYVDQSSSYYNSPPANLGSTLAYEAGFGILNVYVTIK